MSDPNEPIIRCDFCQTPFADGRKWVLLNRYGVGTGKRSALVSVEPDDVYVWDVTDESDSCATGITLCYPSCLLTWIEGKMVETDTVPL